MSNTKYNDRGEVVSVNGLTTGQHLGTPMQDAIAEKPEDNLAYSEERNTVTRAENCVEDKQPTPQGGDDKADKYDVVLEGHIGFVAGNSMPQLEWRAGQLVFDDVRSKMENFGKVRAVAKISNAIKNANVLSECVATTYFDDYFGGILGFTFMAGEYGNYTCYVCQTTETECGFRLSSDPF